jgi:hypothetical protein
LLVVVWCHCAVVLQFWDIVGGTVGAWDEHVTKFPTLDDYRKAAKAKAAE